MEKRFGRGEGLSKHWGFSTALYIVFLCASGSTFLTVLRGIVLVTHGSQPFLGWIVAASADQVAGFLKSIGVAPLAECAREVAGLPQS